ncbi:MAG: membrane protein insertion efficiency factor YidD [candidate division WOR-3 bacterium]|nr:membrane protein insertion efficiency factor YidD [candidate division WOR-3 bacterium]
MRFINKIFIALITLYQKAISPFTPRTCRFYPTCSHYSLEAFKTYNPVKAMGLSIWRILRCNPFHPGGYDPLK